MPQLVLQSLQQIKEFIMAMKEKRKMEEKKERKMEKKEDKKMDKKKSSKKDCRY